MPKASPRENTNIELRRPGNSLSLPIDPQHILPYRVLLRLNIRNDRGSNAGAEILFPVKTRDSYRAAAFNKRIQQLPSPSTKEGLHSLAVWQAHHLRDDVLAEIELFIPRFLVLPVGDLASRPRSYRNCQTGKADLGQTSAYGR